MAMPSEFSLSGYRNLLQGFLSIQYQAVFFDALQPQSRQLILRHDIDLWPALSIPMAEIEAELGCAATYFVLVSSPFYNSGSADSRAVYRRLIELGHRVELHFDASLHEAAGTCEQAAGWECDWLEHQTGAPVRIISFHRPAKQWLGNPSMIAGRPHTYQPRYFQEIGYCSDSRGGWHSGEPLKHPSVDTGAALQLLTHPIWWSGLGIQQSLDRYLMDRLQQIDADLAHNISVHNPGRMNLQVKGGQA